MPKSKDLFDDSTMSFGEHLEALRVHLFKSLIGLFVAVTITLFVSDRIIAVIRRPVDLALRQHYASQSDSIAAQGEQLESLSWWQTMLSWIGFDTGASPEPAPEPDAADQIPADTIRVKISKQQIVDLAKRIDPGVQFGSVETPEADRGKPLDPVVAPESVPAPQTESSEQAATDAKPSPAKSPQSDYVEIAIVAPEFAQLKKTVEMSTRPITLNVQEAFMIYIKVAIFAGLLLAFPYIFYQLWLFISAGLYDHEKRYVFVFLPVSMILFFGGAIFCYFGVFPYVLDFLLDFNDWLGVTPQIRLSEWITFALLLPLMFGISFQLPLVMYFVERLGMVTAKAYREKRRLAILIIAVLSMFLTPADPMSMIMMMVPLILLYELGIIFCKLNPARNPYEAPAS